MAENSKHAKVKDSKLMFENAWVVVKTRFQTLKKWKEGNFDLDAAIAKAKSNAAVAQKIVDDFSTSEGSDEEDDDESVEGDAGDHAEGECYDHGVSSAKEDNNNAEVGNP